MKYSEAHERMLGALASTKVMLAEARELPPNSPERDVLREMMLDTLRDVTDNDELIEALQAKDDEDFWKYEGEAMSSDFDDDDFDDRELWLDDELEEDDGCLFPGECCMPGDHTSDECHTAEMIEQQGDQDENNRLVDLDWLNKLRRKGGDMSILRVRLVDGAIHLMSPCNLPREGIDGLRDYVSPRPATRGDIRKLCEAMGVELIDPTFPQIRAEGENRANG